MSVLVVGVSHRTAPVALLERVTLAVAGEAPLLDELKATGPITEAVVLSTCNRVEVYADSSAFHAGVEAIQDLLSLRSGVPLEELAAHVYLHWEDQAVHHLFSVACGLDSMVVGEAQILGQLRRSYGAASEGAGRTLHELFQKALKVGKRAHTETGIDDAGRSVVTAALDHAASAVGPLDGSRALLVGAGSMSALAGATLRRAGAARIAVVNRTVDNAVRLATSLEGTGAGLDALEDELAQADVVITSTGATGLVIQADVVRRAVGRREGRPLALLDLALPHDVDPAVRSLPGVTLVDLAELQQVLDGGEVGADVEQVRRIVNEEVGEFLAWQHATRVAPTVVALRSRADEVVAAELARLDARLPGLDERARAELRATVRRVVGTLLHTPTVRVKELAEIPDGLSYAEALHELFGLDRTAPAAVTVAPVQVVPVQDGS